MTSADPSSLPAQSPILVYGSSRFDLPSKVSGRTYRIFVFKPPLPPPPSGYPVVVVTDANMSFPIAATMAATFALSGKAVIAVGVGYATDDVMELIRLRNRDLTPLTPLSAIRQNPGRPAPRLEDYGGSEDFYRFLVDELRPAIADAYPVNADDQTLYGHSLGGLFTVGVLLNHPESFRNFVASSPSIFWNNCSTLKDAPSFARKIKAGKAAPRALILVGADEQKVTELLPGVTPAQMKKMLREWRMVDNARALASRIRAVRGRPGCSVEFHALEDEDHLTVLPAAISRALAFALRPSPPPRSWFGPARKSAPEAPIELAEPPAGGDPAVIDGAWTLTVNSPIGVQTSTLVLEINGGMLIGTATSEEGSQQIANGMIDGRKVAWEMSISKPMSLTLKFSGMVVGDRMSGSVKAGSFASFPFSGARA